MAVVLVVHCRNQTRGYLYEPGFFAEMVALRLDDCTNVLWMGFNMSMDADQWEFMHSQALTLSVIAAFQRSHPLPIYAPGASEHSRSAVQETVKSKLNQYGKRYIAMPTENQHIENIREFACIVSQTHTAALMNGTLRIGSAQKALNLYLKYLWCLERIEEPLHCPIDAMTLKGISTVADIRWTQMNTIEDYMRCINALRAVADGQSLARWELLRWNEARRSAPAAALSGSARTDGWALA